MKKICLLIVGLLMAASLFSQEEKLSFQFNRILFRDLADTLEKTVPVKIYYSNKWVDSLYLNINSSNDSLSGLFDKALKNSGYFFLITDDNKLILSKGYRIKSNFDKEYFDVLRRRAAASDTTKYMPKAPETAALQQEEEYKMYQIGNPSALKEGTSATLSGVIKNTATGEPLPGVVIYVDKLKAGAVSNASGFYSMVLPKGQYQIEFRMVGLRSTRRNLIIYSDGVLDVNMTMSTQQLNEVVVTGNKQDNLRDVKMGIEKINVKMLKEIPMGMGEADLIKSSLLLPGVQTVGEASSGFNIRGGNTDQNLILVDDAPIINPSHFFGFFSSFNSDAIEDVTLYKSGIPAKYGGRVSSVMDISLREGSMEKINVSGGISPFTGRLMVEGPVVKNKLSFLVSSRATYSDWILKSLNDKRLQKSTAGFNDFQGLLTYNINKNNKISLSGYLSNDNFNYYELYAIRYTNFSSTLRWKHIFSSKLSGEFSGIISNYSYQLDSEQDSSTYNSLKYKIEQRILKADFVYFPAEKHKLGFGIDATDYLLYPGDQTPIGNASVIQPVSLEPENAIEPSVYLSDDFEVSPRLLISAGLRYSLFTTFGPKDVYQYLPGAPIITDNLIDTLHFGKGKIVKQYAGMEYRFSARYSMGPELSLKAGFQRNYQYLNMISNTISMSPTDIWKLSDSYIRPQWGDQYSIGIFKNIRSRGIETSVEVYYKNLHNLLDYKGGATLLMNDHLETDILSGIGKAYGVEFMIRKQTGDLTGWISYTYARSFVKVDSPFQEDRINNGKYFPANFDEPNDLKIVSNLKLTRRLNFTSNLTYNTGRPITFPVGYYDFYNMSRIFYSDRNAYRIPDYLRLDFSATLNGNLKIRKLIHSSLNFTVYNVLGRKNPYSIFFKAEDGVANAYKMSIFGRPIIMLTYNFRIRGNASTDY